MSNPDPTQLSIEIAASDVTEEDIDLMTCYELIYAGINPAGL